jgi:hypothetical protein
MRSPGQAAFQPVFICVKPSGGEVSDREDGPWVRINMYGGVRLVPEILRTYDAAG